MRVLFSPVGGTDPIAMDNFCDGSMLHICRFYKPDVVYLYMSHEMLEFQKQDDRYRYCLNKLCELQERSMEIKEIERDELITVQKFDFFYNDFRGILSSIQKDLTKDDELLINISSGTPAMKSSLIVLATLLEVPCKTIQVSTPEKALNEHSHKGYDVEVLWNENMDNDPGCDNRCQEVKCPSLSYLKQEQLIQKLISEYDYSAAKAACEQLPDDMTGSYKKYIIMAEKRLQLDYVNIARMIKNEDVPGFPVRDDVNRDIFEYVLFLKVKVRKGEFADFIRGISPVIFELFYRILKKQCGINIKEYVKDDERKGMRWDRVKLSGTGIQTVLKANSAFFKCTGPVYSSQLITVLRKFADQKNSYITLVESLRSVEENARNIAAHQIVAVTDERIFKLTGVYAEEICDLIQKIFPYADINIKPQDWNAYDEMNDFIISRMG